MGSDILLVFFSAVGKEGRSCPRSPRPEGRDPELASLEEVIVVKGVSPPIEPGMGSWGLEEDIVALAC